jgi:hypothetical protein
MTNCKSNKRTCFYTEGKTNCASNFAKQHNYNIQRSWILHQEHRHGCPIQQNILDMENVARKWAQVQESDSQIRVPNLAKVIDSSLKMNRTINTTK